MRIKGMTLGVGRIAAAALMTLALWGVASAQEEDPAVEVSEGSINIGFTPPPNCQELSEEAKAVFTKQGVNLKYGCMTPQDIAIFVMMYGSDEGGEKGLADFEKRFKAAQNKIYPGIKWLDRAAVKINGSKGIRLRFRESPAEDSFINDAYLTDWVGHFIVFIGGAPASKYQSLKADLEKSAKSVQLSITVIAPANLGAPDVKEKP